MSKPLAVRLFSLKPDAMNIFAYHLSMEFFHSTLKLIGLAEIRFIFHTMWQLSLPQMVRIFPFVKVEIWFSDYKLFTSKRLAGHSG